MESDCIAVQRYIVGKAAHRKTVPSRYSTIRILKTRHIFEQIIPKGIVARERQLCNRNCSVNSRAIVIVEHRNTLRSVADNVIRKRHVAHENVIIGTIARTWRQQKDSTGLLSLPVVFEYVVIDPNILAAFPLEYVFNRVRATSPREPLVEVVVGDGVS